MDALFPEEKLMIGRLDRAGGQSAHVVVASAWRPPN